jgi:hypothetical protein
MTDIVERLAGIRRQLDGSKNPYAAGTVQAGISEIERLRRIINDVHPQMQTRIDALTAAQVALRAWLDADDAGDGHAVIHAMAAARKALAMEPGHE